MQAAAALVLALAATTAVVERVSAARSTQVQRARYSVQGAKTRVVLDLSGKTGYRITRHKNPERIAINIPNARVSKSFSGLTLKSGVVRRVRVNRLSWGTQVVLDLSRSAELKNFALARNGNLPDRIVLDVFDSPSTKTPARSGGGAVPRKRTTGDTYIVAIDPGHGGYDPGTSKVEKTLNLQMSKIIAARINAIDGYRAILVRDRDVFLSVNKRAAIAASHNADVFVSVHVNWAPSRSARGSEVWFLSPKGANWTSKKMLSNPERAANEFGLTGRESSDLIHMLVDVNKQSVMNRSELLAESILESMNKKGLPPTRSLKQRGWAVLRTFETPSVLVETGFISNSSDAKILKSESGRERIAEAVANGIVSYFTEFPPPRGRHDPVVVHKVRRGESLWKISRQYNTSIASIRRANNMGSSSMLRPGQELIITNRY